MKIAFNKTIEFEKQGVCVGEDDVYFNYYTIKEDHLINGSVPWRGTCEEHLIFFIWMFIEALPKVGTLIVDAATSIGCLYFSLNI
jgi:hypothetical protein